MAATEASGRPSIARPSVVADGSGGGRDRRALVRPGPGILRVDLDADAAARRLHDVAEVGDRLAAGVLHPRVAGRLGDRHLEFEAWRARASEGDDRGDVLQRRLDLEAEHAEA